MSIEARPGKTTERATRLTVLCRGATQGNRRLLFSSNEPLLPKEAERSASLARQICAFDTVFHAPEISAAQTAVAFSATAASSSALKDVDYGEWNDRSFADVSEQCPEDVALWLSNPASAPHGGESFDAAQARAVAWLHTLHSSGGNILAVTHSIILKLLFAEIVGASLAAIGRIDVEPLGMLILTSDGKRWALRGFGQGAVYVPNS